jgi:type VI secretion system secreted protein Hcp
MAQISRMTTKGMKTGAFKGGSTRKGWENTTEFHGFDYVVSTAFDANRGSSSGKRRHDPVTVVAQIDKATPLYWNSLVTNEVLTTVKLDFFKPKPGGSSEENYYTVTLTNATITSCRQFTEKESTHSESTDTYEQFEVKFAFQKIDVTWLDGGITGSDDWNVVA